MKNIVELYWLVDEIVKMIKKNFPVNHKVGRKSTLSKSELITIVLLGHNLAIPTDKLLYDYVKEHLNKDFKNIPCYAQFTKGIRSTSRYLDLMLSILCQMNSKTEKGFYIIDSTALPTNGYDKYDCPKWASGDVKKGKNIFGFYHGYKLHIIINRNLEVVSCLITPANVHDVKALSIDSFINTIHGTLVGDKGYVVGKDIKQKLKELDINLIFKQRKNMDPYLNEYYKEILRQRQVIEGVFSVLKNRLNLLHRFARCVESFLVHVKAALAAFIINKLEDGICLNF
jgi:hypothetical protein